MEQGSNGQNKTGAFLMQNQIYIIIGVLLVAVIIFFATRGSNPAEENGDQTNTETTENTGANSGNTENQNNNQQDDSSQVAGNFTTSGVLKTSDNPARGNLMIETPNGNLYIATSRDFSNLLGTSVKLNADGDLNNFRFLGFNDSVVAPTPDNQPDLGGAPEATEERNFTFGGKLQKSNNSSMGNYMVVGEDSSVYLKSVRDYSSFIGSDVTLSANGTFESFTNAIVTR